MNRTSNRPRRLRQLSPVELRAATGGFVIYGRPTNTGKAWDWEVSSMVPR